MNDSETLQIKNKKKMLKFYRCFWANLTRSSSTQIMHHQLRIFCNGFDECSKPNADIITLSIDIKKTKTKITSFKMMAAFCSLVRLIFMLPIMMNNIPTNIYNPNDGIKWIVFLFSRTHLLYRVYACVAQQPIDRSNPEICMKYNFIEFRFVSVFSWQLG